MGGRALSRALVTLIAAVAGAVWLSGSDQPVTAHPFPAWQELAAPPLSPRTHPLGLHVGHRVLVLGGRDRGRLRDGAAYDLRNGTWRAVRLPIAVTDRDSAVAAAGVAVLRHLRPGRAPAWWRYDARQDAWERMEHVPAHASVPTAYHSEVYAVAAGHVVVYSVQLGRWTALRADPLRPRLHHRRVSASRSGTVVTGYVAGRSGPVADRWDGRRWRRLAHAVAPPAASRPTSTGILVGGRLIVLRRGRAWIHTP
jgi:hypothetical protein